LLETVFYVPSVQSGYKEEFSWLVDFRSSKWTVSWGLRESLEAAVEDDGEEET
jgi:hypothetical protein